MNKMDGKSKDITNENIEFIKEHFPEAVSEGKVKFDVLKQLLGEYVEESDERYEFTWNGKGGGITAISDTFYRNTFAM